MSDPVSPVDSPTLDLDDVMGEIASGRVWRTVKALVDEVERLREALAEARDVARDSHDRFQRAVKTNTESEIAYGNLADEHNAEYNAVVAERDRLAETVARVEALCDSGVFDVREWGERGTPFSNGCDRAFRRVKVALAVPAATEETDR